jgi:hypothetical protein
MTGPWLRRRTGADATEAEIETTSPAELIVLCPFDPL